MIPIGWSAATIEWNAKCYWWVVRPQRTALWFWALDN